MDQPSLPGLPTLPSFATDNPREVRIICALVSGPCSRETLDRIAGASNVPDAIAKLRLRGLEIPCDRNPSTDRDGEVVYRGEYRLTDADRARTVHVWGRL